MSDTWRLVEGDAIAPGLSAVSRLGGGDMYEVWMAFDERLHTLVVIKMLRPSHVDSASSRHVVRREVEMLKRLQHPSVVRMFSYDDSAMRPYIVMEYVDGPTLSSLISKHGALPIHQLMPLALELSAALHYLDAEGVSHLDIKPSNVIMGAPAKLIDLSLAMESKVAAELDHPLGSDEYMAPEQIEPGIRGQVGPASDVWGMGATLFRAAAGYRAFDRQPQWAQLHDAPYALPDTVPPMVGSIILDCLAPDPADRPTPAEVVARIEPVMDALPTAWLSGFSLNRSS
ncbi:serine/threonine-protein kinase [Aeromicrobium sp.]|uniref:serine/threonine-protein kinase n=1 Tax=Aeromicrobium sp. TaxID=1871063 RepID=UPI003D6B68CF